MKLHRIIAAALVLSVSSAAAAAAGCPPVEQALTELAETYGERGVLVGRSLSEDGSSNGAMILTANNVHKTWTILVATSGGACIRLYGDSLEAVDGEVTQ